MNNCVYVENFLGSVHLASKDRTIRLLVGDGVHRHPFRETLEERLDGSDWLGVAKGCNVYEMRMGVKRPKVGNVSSVLTGSREVAKEQRDAFLARP